MAIAFNSSTSGTSAGSTTVTVSHTASGNDRIVFAYTFDRNLGGLDTVTGVTYGGTAMTFIETSGAINPAMRVYYLIAPSTGAQDCIATRTSSANNFSLSVHSYTGAKQSGQPDAYIYSSEAVPGSQTLTKYITTVANGAWITAMCASPSTITASTGATERQAITTLLKTFDSNEGKTPAGSNGMTFTFGTDADPLHSILVSITPEEGFIPKVMIF